MTTPPEVWLRGALPGIDPYLQPAAHALLQVREDVEAAIAPLNDDQLWERPGGVATIGFHLLHLAGSIDRLLTYSRGKPLDPEQLLALGAEKTVHEDRPGRSQLVVRLSHRIDEALHYFRTVPSADLLQPREVGKKKLPSTTLGLIFHAAEHGSRHAGQIVTLAGMLRNPPSST